MALLIGLDILLRLILVEKKTAAEWTPENIRTGRDPAATYGTFEPTAANTDQQENPCIESRDDRSSERYEVPGPTESNPSIQTEGIHESSTQRPDHYPPLLTLVSSPRILADLYATFINVSLLVGFDSALPIFLERTFGWGSTGGGLIFATITLPILGAPLAGKLTDKYQSPWVPAVGFVIVGGLTALLHFVNHNSTEQIALLVSILTLNGCVRVISSSPLGADLYRAAVEMEKDQPGLFGKNGAYGQVFSLYTMASAAGVFLGPLWTGYAYGKRGWTFLVFSLGGFCASVALPLILSRALTKIRKDPGPSNAV
ncbi:MAG: hypothetical protein Q9219_007449 [cf. Caloplaca sp. 3 TL-2023]